MGTITDAGDVGYSSTTEGSSRAGAAHATGARATRKGSMDGGATTAAIPRPRVHAGAAPRRRAAYDRRLYVELCRASDVVVALVVLGAVFVVVNTETRAPGWDEFLLLRLNFPKLLELGLFAFLWQQIFRVFGLYETDGAPLVRDEAPRIIAACTLGALTSTGFSFLSESGAFRAFIPLIAWPPTVLATLSARTAVRKLAERTHDEPKRVLVVGSGPLAYRLYLDLTSGKGRDEVVGFVDSNPDVRFGEIRARLVGTLEQLEQILMHDVVDEVFVALPIKSHYTAIQRVIEECERAGIQSRYSLDVFHTTIASPRLETADARPAVALHVSPHDQRLLVKRAIDVVGAATGLLLTAPLWVCIAIAIKTTSPGPVFFAQERYGLRKRRFRMVKFRTMVSNAEQLQAGLESRNEATGPVFKITDDPRVTRVGRFLRRKSLDELPQLWNVLRGDMSLVGPRPLPMRDVRRFGEAWLMRRFSVAPGLTGLWQISGRSDLPFDEWITLDLEYIDRWSLGLDIQILLRTIPAVLRGAGAS